MSGRLRLIAAAAVAAAAIPAAAHAKTLNIDVWTGTATDNKTAYLTVYQQRPQVKAMVNLAVNCDVPEGHSLSLNLYADKAKIRNGKLVATTSKKTAKSQNGTLKVTGTFKRGKKGTAKATWKVPTSAGTDCSGSASFSKLKWTLSHGG